MCYSLYYTAEREGAMLPLDGCRRNAIACSRVWTKACPSCSWSAEQGSLFFSCPRSGLGIWSCKTDSAVPSRVSLLIRHTEAESDAYSTHALLSFISLSAIDYGLHGLHLSRLYRHPPSGHCRVCLSRRAIAHRWRSLPRVRRHRARSPQCTVVPVTGAAFQIYYHHGPVLWSMWYNATAITTTVVYVLVPL